MSKELNVNIVKANGERELYSRDKFQESLRRAGTDEDLIDRVRRKVEGRLREGMTTGQLYSLARKFLVEESTSSAAKYSLRKAIMDLGPAGYLFEKYIAAILREYGYKAKTNVKIKGECISHEVDILAEKENVVYIIEAKYHNFRGIKSDTKVVLYTYARFLDIRAGNSKFASAEPWLITNTKFTSQAVKYGKCRGIRMSGWRHPRDESLENLIEAKGLYPITAIPAVSKYARKRFAEAEIFFARDLADFSAQEIQKSFGIHESSAREIERQVSKFISSIHS